MNWLGCYEIPDRKAVYELGDDMTTAELIDIKAELEKSGKALFVDDYVILKNSERYENHLQNIQLMRTALSQFKALPDKVKVAFLQYKPKEVVDQYLSVFSSLDYNLPSNLQVTYEVGYTVSEDIRHKTEDVSNKTEDKRQKTEDINTEDIEDELIKQHYQEVEEEIEIEEEMWNQHLEDVAEENLLEEETLRISNEMNLEDENNLGNKLTRFAEQNQGKKSGIHTQWQQSAFNWAESLKIDFRNVGEDLKIAWLKLFKDSETDSKKMGAMNKAYGQMVDYPKFHEIPTDARKVTYFLKVVNNNIGGGDSK